MLPVTNLALKGLYLGVGTERAFITTRDQSSNPVRLFFDIDPSDRALQSCEYWTLSMAVDPTRLCLARDEGASWTDIEQRWIQNGMQNSRLQAHFEWFIQVLRHENQGDLLNSNFLTISEKCKLFAKNPELCLRLMQMAKETSHLHITTGFKNPKNQQGIYKILNITGHPKNLFLIVDISNAWWESHAGLQTDFYLFQNLKNQLHPQGILLMTTYRKPHSFHWGYFGISHSSLQDKKRTMDF